MRNITLGLSNWTSKLVEGSTISYTRQCQLTEACEKQWVHVVSVVGRDDGRGRGERTTKRVRDGKSVR